MIQILDNFFSILGIFQEMEKVKKDAYNKGSDWDSIYEIAFSHQRWVDQQKGVGAVWEK